MSVQIGSDVKSETSDMTATDIICSDFSTVLYFRTFSDFQTVDSFVTNDALGGLSSSTKNGKFICPFNHPQIFLSVVVYVYIDRMTYLVPLPCKEAHLLRQ